jgi:uncharacterized SAM-binding protein YcdF (DUF218 family)
MSPRIQKRLCDENGWKHPILISFHPHLWRAMMVSKRVGLDVLIPNVPNLPFDRRVIHPWLRYRWTNALREIPCRLLWLFQGKI